MKYRFRVSMTNARRTGTDVPAVPESFSFEDEDGHAVLIVSAEEELDDDSVTLEVQRECDRLSFFTGEQMDPVLTERRHGEGGGVASDLNRTGFPGGSIS